MQNRMNRHRMVMAAVIGMGLLGGTTAIAEHPREVRSPDVPATQGSYFRNTDLTGGFYKDQYKLDNWYYDFYDSPGATRTSSRNMDFTSYGEPVGLADAAHPWTAIRSQHRTDQIVTFQQYYDEPWFYDQRDPAYSMPMARGGNLSSDTTVRSDDFLKGTVTATKQVRNRTTGAQNTAALVKTQDGRRIITDLGPTRHTLDLALTQGDQIQVGGQWEEIGPYSVLMAQHIKSGVNRVTFHRESGAVVSDNRQVEGRIQQFRDIRVNRTAELHRTAAVQTPDGRFAIVDLGQDTTENVVAHASPGDRIVANGRVVQVGNYPVLLADRLSINDGAATHIVRSDAEVAPSGPPSGEGSLRMRDDPSCVGGGCEGYSVDQGQPRVPHGNAMDGKIRSEQP